MRPSVAFFAFALATGCDPTVVMTPASTDAGVVTDVAGDVPHDVGQDAGPSCPVSPSTEPGVVATDRGAVRGVTSGGVRSFKGIPYAAPPVGALRWRAPEPAACWSGVRDANAFGPICPQLDASNNPTGQEDCLSLNVWTPEAAPAAPLPIMVFVHGGGFNQGSSAVSVGDVAVYDGRQLAARGAVVVTLNYRLGALGFLSHGALDAESTDHTSGNYALLDVLAALRWVQANARAFGGDPARVLLFGESAGGVHVCLLAASPLSTGLFSRALVESGGCTASPRATANAAGDRLLAATGCATRPDALACLRSQTPEALLRALPADVTGISPNDFNPSIDGRVLPGAPLERVAAGTHQRVPIVIGTNANEASRMVPATVVTAMQYETAARAYLSQYGLNATQVNAVLAAYPASGYDSPRAALIALITDSRWTCPARSYLRAFRGAQTEPVYRYFFTRGLDPTRAPLASRDGAYHAIELFYVFGSLNIAGYRPTDNDLAVSEAVQGYWLRFAATGDPNGAGAPAWPAFESSMDNHLEINAPPRAGAGVRTALCDALAAAVGR